MVKVKTKFFQKAIASIITLAMLFSTIGPVQGVQAAGEELKSLEIDGVGKVYYIVDPAEDTVHSEADEWEHIDYTLPDGIGSKEMRLMNDADIAYYVVAYPEMPDKNGKEQEGGIPDTLYGTAKLSHLEFWQSEGVEALTLTGTSSAEKDEEGYYDLGGFDTVVRATLTYGPAHTAFQFENIFYAVDAETYEDAVFAPTFKVSSFVGNTYESVGSPYVGAAIGENHISVETLSAGDTEETARDYLLERYEIPGYENIPVSVNGTAYIENVIKLDAGVGNVPSAFKNVTIGGKIKYFYDFDAADNVTSFDVDVDADTGLCKHLNNDGTYGKAAEGQNVYTDLTQSLQSNGGWETNGADYNYNWGNYQDSYIYLQAGDSASTTSDLTTQQYFNYVTHFLGAKYEYYGDVDELGVSSPEDISTLDDLEAAGASKVATYGSTFAADTWWAPYKKARVEIGFNFDSLRLGGTGANTSEDGISNYGNAQGKTGYYKITLYAVGYENIEKLVYVKSQYKVPEIAISDDLNTITLKELDDGLKTKIINGTATVTLNMKNGRTSEVVATLNKEQFNADYNTYDVSGITLSAETEYLLVFSFGGAAADITTDSFTTTYVAGLTMSESTLKLKIGAGSALSVAISPEGAVLGTVITWSSSDEAVATVDQNGKVTAKAAGSATITATSGNGITATCDVTVAEKAAQTLSGIASYSKTYGDGEFTLDTKGSGSLSYTSGNTKVVTVDKTTGRVTVVGAGTAVITVTAAETEDYKGATKTVTITVAKASQAISANSATKAFGAKAFSLGATRTKGDGALTYSSSNTKVATVNVSSGAVTIKSTGKTTITITATATANYEKTTKTVTVTVTKASQAISAKSATKTYGAKAFSLGAKRTKGDGKLTYKSSDTKVATVNASGKVTIKRTGKTTITITAAATTNYQKTTKTVTITVKPKKATISSVTSSAKKKATVKWKRDSQATGYQVQYSTSSSFKSSNSTKLVSKNTTVKKTLTGLKSSKKYYIRVRSYKTISGKNVYGAWSTKKSIKVK